MKLLIMQPTPSSRHFLPVKERKESRKKIYKKTKKQLWKRWKSVARIITLQHVNCVTIHHYIAQSV
jgi:hypothetical protein